MARKQMAWKTKGMNRDLSVSAFNNEFAFENYNLRLSTKEGNTAMSWVNEKGTAKLSLKIDIAPWIADADWSEQTPKYTKAIDGIPIGTAVLNHQLVLFTKNTATGVSKPDYIYVLWKSNQQGVDLELEGKILYNGNLNFSVQHPIETMVSFEADYIQKIYWTDNYNQPRLINIAADNSKIKLWNSGDGSTVDTFFDFVPAIKMNDKFKVEIINHPASGGMFAPGVIQYCITYINKHAQQSNIAYLSSLYYLSFTDRAGSPEEKVANTFEITIKNPDESFDYVRLYSIHRSSLNGVPYVKLLEDLSMKNVASSGSDRYLSYTDKGTTGSSVDPTELLYVGGREITALTMIDKDNTLFMGNLTQKGASVDAIQDYFLDNLQTIEFAQDATKELQTNHATGTYTYTNELGMSQEQITTFKGGETYRFGVQFQKNTGEWTEPIYLNDVTNTLYPNTNVYSDTIQLAHAQADIDFSSIDGFANYGFKRVRPVVVFPSIGDRSVICQGVLNPTVFNVEDRKDKIPFAQASWFFRPYMTAAYDSDDSGTDIPFTHYDKLVQQHGIEPENIRKIEIQGSIDSYDNVYDTGAVNINQSNTQFFIDQSIVTLNSPDIEFDTEVQSIGWDNFKLHIVGAIPITSCVSSHAFSTQSVMWPTCQNLDSVGYHIHRFGVGEKNKEVLYNNINTKAGRRLAAEYLWNDSAIGQYKENTAITTSSFYLYNFVIHPWHRSGSFNNDYRSGDTATSKIKTKKLSNLLFSSNVEYFSKHGVSFNHSYDVSAQLHLTENEQIYNIRLPKQLETSSDINYYANVDKVLYRSSGYTPLYALSETSIPGQDEIVNFEATYTSVDIRYKSTSHAVLALNAETNNNTSKVPILPYAIDMGHNIGEYIEAGSGAGLNTHTTFWGDTGMEFSQDKVCINGLFNENLLHKSHNFLWLGELYNTGTPTFGGRTKEAIKANSWQIGGEAVDINGDVSTTLKWTIGDTYYQRYDCLKTYAFSDEDTNQIVEILSFMCETHVNLDGRYDRNRGQDSNIDMSPQNFNLLNSVYSQKDNYFTYKKTGTEDINGDIKYPNYITYSKTKTPGADVDLYTNVTLGSTLEMDGDKGQITSLRRLNDKIIAFQDTSISQILYNENVQISSENGVPIEIANSGKVQGKRYLSDTIGCSNKWSVVSTPLGMYFMDSTNKGIYLFNGELSCVSSKMGFDAWSKQNIPSIDVEWNPSTLNNFVSYYDKQNQDVLFINKDTCLAFSEKTGTFTSFYSYEGTPYFCDLDGMGLWVRNPFSINSTALWAHREGSYGKFFGVNEPYYTVLVGNPEPQLDKIFTNLDFRATVEGDGVPPQGQSFTPYLPFDSLEVWNEFQHGIAQIGVRNGHDAMVHHLNNTTGAGAVLKRKFRIWRCDIPRDNYKLATTFEERKAELDKGISRYYRKPTDRMRNTWLYLKLQKNAETDSAKSLPQSEMHDVMMTFFD